MTKEHAGEGFSRRRFIEGLGAGIAAGYAALAPGVRNAAARQEGEPDAAAGGKEVPLSLTVNGKRVEVAVEPRTTLAELLRERLGLTGTKVACNHGECGACTVLLDGKAVYSCHLLALDAAGGEVVTIEGLLSGEDLHPIQQAFVEHDGLQCGFCTPGQIMATQALLLENPKPAREDVLRALSGNLCRCAAYPNIVASALAAAERSKQ